MRDSCTSRHESGRLLCVRLLYGRLLYSTPYSSAPYFIILLPTSYSCTGDEAGDQYTEGLGKSAMSAQQAWAAKSAGAARQAEVSLV